MIFHNYLPLEPSHNPSENRYLPPLNREWRDIVNQLIDLRAPASLPAAYSILDDAFLHHLPIGRGEFHEIPPEQVVEGLKKIHQLGDQSLEFLAELAFQESELTRLLPSSLELERKVLQLSLAIFRYLNDHQPSVYSFERVGRIVEVTRRLRQIQA